MQNHVITLEWKNLKPEILYTRLSCISLNPPILRSHDEGEDNDESGWAFKNKDGCWHNTVYDTANESYAAVLDRALEYFIKLEQDIENALLTE